MYTAEQWEHQAIVTLESAQLLFSAGRYRDAASRAYYAAYQAATSASVKHGDEVQFPPNWNNPTHEQLPGLIRNNGDLSVDERKKVGRLLEILRLFREDADYRPGRTVDSIIGLQAISGATAIFRRIGIESEQPPHEKQ